MVLKATALGDPRISLPKRLLLLAFIVVIYAGLWFCILPRQGPEPTASGEAGLLVVELHGDPPPDWLRPWSASALQWLRKRGFPF
jgi:hypothetical protein